MTVVRALLLLFVAVELVGCASTPTATSYLDNYERLAPGKYLEKYWADTAAITPAPSARLTLGDIQTDTIADKKGVTVANSAEWLRAGVTRGELFAPGAGPAAGRLDLAITFMDPGSAAARIWAGELGAGHAQVQVEGRVTDPASGKLLAAFAERRRSSGAIGLQDMGGDAGPSLIRTMIDKITEAANQELAATFRSEQAR